MESFLVVFISIAAGILGYLITTFWIRPILWYRDIKYQVTSDLIFYANAIKDEFMDKKMTKRVHNRVESNRRHSADMLACYLELPCWYKWWLQHKGEDPESASGELIGLSNTYDWESAEKRVDKIKKYLRIKLSCI